MSSSITFVCGSREGINYAFYSHLDHAPMIHRNIISPWYKRLPLLHQTYHLTGRAQTANAKAPINTQYIIGDTENDTAPRPVNWAKPELVVALAVALSDPPTLPSRSVKLAQVIRVAFPKWTVMERLPKKEPRPSTVDAKSSR